MKATGIVRRIEARVIITPRAIKRINTGFFTDFQRKIFDENSIFSAIHRKSVVKFQ